MFVVPRLRRVGRASHILLNRRFTKPQEAIDFDLWEVLVGFRASPQMVRVISVSHDGIQARVQIYYCEPSERGLTYTKDSGKDAFRPRFRSTSSVPLWKKLQRFTVDLIIVSDSPRTHDLSTRGQDDPQEETSREAR